jgi:hypothetical protein
VFDENTLTTGQEALRFVNKYGIVTLFPIRGLSFPNLYQATFGKSKEERFQRAWEWADYLSEKKKIHYGKLVRGQVTLISLEMFPYLYGIRRGCKLSKSAQKILGFLLKKGATSTTLLRENLNFTGKAKKNEFTKAIDELQATFYIAIVSREKTPKMTYSYDLIERWMPENLIEESRKASAIIAKEKIRSKLAESNMPGSLNGILPR